MNFFYITPLVFLVFMPALGQEPPPLKQWEAGVGVDNIVCNDPLKIFLRSDFRPICVTDHTSVALEQRWGYTTVKSLSDEIVKLFTIEMNSFEVPVTVKNASIQNVYANESESIVLDMDAFADGFITIDIPRKLADASSLEGDDIPFTVLIGKNEILHEEMSTDSESRKLLIPFEEGYIHIEIYGADEI